jgi:hypothetical protein
MIFLDFLESLPLPQLFLLTIICGLTLGALVLVGVRGTVRLLRLGRTRPLPIRDALISSSSAMFALMVAFSAAGIWSDAIQARGAVQREGSRILLQSHRASQTSFGRWFKGKFCGTPVERYSAIGRQ